MGDVIKKKLSVYVIISAGCMVLLAIYSTLFVLNWYNSTGIDERKVRVDYNSLVYKVEAAANTNSDELASVSEVPFTLVGLDGRVVYTQGMDYAVGQQLNLHTISTVNSSYHEYKIPVIHDGEQFGTLLVGFNGDEYRKPILYPIALFSPILLGLFVMIICIYKLLKVLKQDVFYPIEELHDTTKNIMGGNLASPLTYDFEGQIGSLCHDFELMRCELQQSYLREQEYKEKETLLLASISHDLKTPIANITGYVEGILYDVVEEKEDIKNYARIILNKTNSLNKLIDDILEHSKAHLNQFSIQKEEVYAKEFFAKLLQDIELDAKQKEFEFTYESAPNILLSLDARRIVQVMHNIVENSIKYGKTNGKINTSFSILNDMLIVAVEDNGIGISAGDLPFIFDKFYRGDKARTQGIAGSGLGLNISKYIVEQHGGKIECDSILGVGTKIMFSLNIV